MTELRNAISLLSPAMSADQIERWNDEKPLSTKAGRDRPGNFALSDKRAAEHPLKAIKINLGSANLRCEALIDPAR